MVKTTTGGVGQNLLEVWQQHMYAEFVMKDAKAALATMSDHPQVLMVPVSTGGRDWGGVYAFYQDLLLAQLPADMTSVTLSQALGSNVLAEEAVYRFTHDQVMDWLVPGVPVTGKHVEFGVVNMITFEDGKIATEHIYWDHASVLAQLGVIDPSKIPVKGVESARTLLEWTRTNPAAT